MFDCSYYLHYVLDIENDFHYTEDLMRLSPDSYLWHELKERKGFSNVVFVNQNGGRLELETFDNASFCFLQPVKKKWFGKVDKQSVDESICRKPIYLEEIKQEESTLLDFLLKCQEKHKTENTAVVCTSESLKRLYECSGGSAKEKLKNNIVKNTSRSILVVRLSMSTAALRETFLDGYCFLRELDGNIKGVLGGYARQPLLKTLSGQLGGRLVDFSRQNTDMVNLLMYDALENGTGQDSPNQLWDQSEYLRSCLDCGVALAEPFLNAPRHEPLKRNTIYKKLVDPNFRSRLRNEASRLRSQNADSSMEDLFCREFGLRPNDSGIREVYFDDELYRKVCSLILPEEYLKENLAYGQSLKELRKAVTTLWNKPRSQKVCDMIRDTVDAALEAVSRTDWITLTDAMVLLSLCTRQICAELVLNDNLDEIFNTGRELLRASAELNRQKRNFEEQWDYNKKKADRDLDEATRVIHAVNDTVLEGKEKKLGMLRRSLYETILYFDDHPLNEQVEKKLRESVCRWKDKLDQVQYDNELFGTFNKDASDDESPYGDL